MEERHIVSELEHIKKPGQELDKTLRAFIASFCDGKQEITIFQLKGEDDERLFQNRIEELLLDESLEYLLDKEIWIFEPSGPGAFWVWLYE